LSAERLFPLTYREGFNFERICFDDTENDLVDYQYACDSITEDLLENVPKLQGTTKQMLTFIRRLFVQFLLEDLLQAEAVTDKTRHQSEIGDFIRSRVEIVISLFFATMNMCLSRKKRRPGSTGRTVCGIIWQGTLQNVIRPHVVNKIISIISIPASEASCERSFSRQTRIMGHSRVGRNRDLFRARFLLKGGPRE
jgi:hypothetical protein